MESEELARKGAAQDKGQECKEDSARPVFGEPSKVESGERRENEYFVEQDAVLPIAQPTSEPGLTCSGLDAGMEIEDFINETVEEGKSDKVSSVERQQQQLAKSTTTIAKSSAATPPSTATTAPPSSSEIVTEKITIDQERAIQEEEKSDGTAANVEQSQRKVVEVPVTLTAGENEETIDGAALQSVQLKPSTTKDGTDKTTATPNSTAGHEKETAEEVAAAPKANAKAPKSCVVNMASDDNRGKKDGQKGGAKSNGRSKKNQADQAVVVVEGEAAAAVAAKAPAKRGRKPGSKRVEKADASKSRSSSGEPKAPPVTLDLTTQPFSDAQQVQLRAQILVYGAIIQGSLADETLMGAAFTDISKVRNLESFETQAGTSKSLWEKAWKTASERMLKAAGKFGGRNSPPAPRPPPSSLSPTNLPKSPSSKGKKNAATPAPAVTTSIASELPSVSPVATSVMSMASATVASWNSARARAPSPMGSAVDSWLYRSSFPFAQHLNLSGGTAPQQPPSQWGVPSQFSTPLRGNWGVFSQASFGSQPLGFPLYTSPQPGMKPPPPPAPAALEGDRGKSTGKRKRLDDSESTPAPGSSSQVLPSDVSPATAGLLEDNDHSLGIMSREELERLRGEDLVHRLESAKKKAEEAASAASSMVEQSQTVWDDIKEKQRSKGMSTREAQLASSLAAVSAAASVAKAAAAAANVAYAAALQARAMANEIVLSRQEASNFENDTDPTVTHVTQGEERSAQLKSALSGAKVAMKQHVEATALAFTKAENLEAVVRAAELAAQAASQAGKVMSLGDPVSLASSEKNAKAGGKVSGKRNARSKAAGAKRKNRSNMDEDAIAKEQNEENSAEGEGTQGNETTTAIAPKGDEVAVINKPGAAQGDVVDAEPSEGLVEDKQLNRPEEIAVGSHVEIVPDEDGLQGVWFSAKVKTLNGDDALVVYDELLDDDGNGKLEEWVNITSRIDNVPRVRTAHPMTKDGGMRKRRRASQGSQKCYVDDHVDVWMRDGWWEGIVQSVDESLVTVFFPGDGDTEATKSWNLRPSLVWKDDAWVLWRDTLGHKSKKQKVENGGGNLSSQEQETPETPAGKKKKLESATPTPGTSETPTPRTAARTGAKPTKRRKFSDVIEKDQEARDAKQTPPSKPPKQQQGRLKKSTPSSSKKSPPPSRKAKQTSNTKNDEGEVRKSGRMIHPTSKLLEGLETTPKAVGKKSGTQQSTS